MNCRTVRTFDDSIERFIVDDPLIQRGLDKNAMVTWVSSMAPWQVIAHLTWRDRVGEDGIARGISVEAARRGFEGFMRRELSHVSYFYAVELNPSRLGSHVHAIWADCKNVYRKEVWASWFKHRGRARIEPVKSVNDVSDYCSKYITKECVDQAWWNVKLQWHRVQALNNRDFKLREETF
jgi:hypothetical protein